MADGDELASGHLNAQLLPGQALHRFLLGLVDPDMVMGKLPDAVLILHNENIAGGAPVVLD